MTARDFCFWLQGYIEITAAGGVKPGSVFNGLSAQQVGAIKQHLALVFKHEIDPSMGDEAHQNDLNNIHNAPFKPPAHGPGGVTMRC